jgi:hypothetical protein
MDKVKMDITNKTLEELGVRTSSILQGLEAMNPMDMKPEYIKAYLLLRHEQQDYVPS